MTGSITLYHVSYDLSSELEKKIRPASPKRPNARQRYYNSEGVSKRYNRQLF